MQQNRRIGVEYENQPTLVGFSTPTLTLSYVGQEDPTTQTGTISQRQTSTQSLISINANVVVGQVLTAQADFGAFTGVCVSLSISASGTASQMALVRLTQVADLPKAQLP